jgi:hypothetical protein
MVIKSWVSEVGFFLESRQLESRPKKQFVKCLQGGRKQSSRGLWGGDALLPSAGNRKQKVFGKPLESRPKIASRGGCRVSRTSQLQNSSTPEA